MRTTCTGPKTVWRKRVLSRRRVYHISPNSFRTRKAAPPLLCCAAPGEPGAGDVAPRAPCSAAATPSHEGEVVEHCATPSKLPAQRIPGPRGRRSEGQAAAPRPGWRLPFSCSIITVREYNCLYLYERIAPLATLRPPESLRATLSSLKTGALTSGVL